MYGGIIVKSATATTRRTGKFEVTGHRLTNRALLPISHAPLTCTKVCLARTGVIMVRNERKEGRDNMMKRDQVKRLAASGRSPIAGSGTCCVAIRYGPRHAYIPLES